MTLVFLRYKNMAFQFDFGYQQETPANVKFANSESNPGSMSETLNSKKFNSFFFKKNKKTLILTQESSIVNFLK